MGTTYTDAEYAAILLSSTPESYASVLGGLNTVAHTSGIAITSSQVILLISDEYDCRIIKKGNNNNKEAFTASTQKRDMHKVECYNCHNFGHTKSECWAKGGDKEGQCPPRCNNSNSNSNSNNDG